MDYRTVGPRGRFIEFGLTLRVIDGIYAEHCTYFSGDISPSLISSECVTFNSKLPCKGLSIISS